MPYQLYFLIIDIAFSFFHPSGVISVFAIISVSQLVSQRLILCLFNVIGFPLFFNTPKRFSLLVVCECSLAVPKTGPLNT